MQFPGLQLMDLPLADHRVVIPVIPVILVAQEAQVTPQAAHVVHNAEITFLVSKPAFHSNNNHPSVLLEGQLARLLLLIRMEMMIVVMG